MDPLVLEAHQQGPEGAALREGAVQVGVRLEQLADDAVDRAAVGVDLLDRGPLALVLGEVVPGHLVDAGLEEVLVVGVERVADQPGKTQLVDVEHCRMAVVEDERMAQVMVGRPVEGFLARERGEEHLGQGPGVVEVGEGVFAGAAAVVEHGQGGDDPLGVHPRAAAVDRRLAGPPPVGARPFQGLVCEAPEVEAPRLVRLARRTGGEARIGRRGEGIGLQEKASSGSARRPHAALCSIIRPRTKGQKVFDI
ncbi:hypothetical protein D3C86_1476660 [compost metagenome]